MGEDRDVEDLLDEQQRRKRVEERLAETAPDDEEAAQHERRSAKAAYLQEKLQERLESERQDG